MGLWGLFLAAPCLLAWCSGTATAASLPVLLTRFGGSGIGTSFAHPTGIAIDQSAPTVSGNVLVADGRPHEQIDVFGPEGEAPLGGVSTQLTHSFDFIEEPVGVAIDNSGGASNGDLYVDDVENNVIEKFSLVGGTYEYVCEIAGYGSGCLASAGTPTQAFVEPVGLAVDMHGNLYVSDYGHEVVDEFSETGADVSQIKGSGVPLELPSGLALDARGDLYVQQYRGGKVLEYAANLLGEVEPNEEPTVLDAGPAYGVAVNSHTGQVYVAHAAAVTEYSPSGAPEGEFGSGVIGEASGIAVNAATGNIYIADAAHGEVEVFGAPPVGPPLIVDESVRNVTPTSALLAAQVNAMGFDTHCHFQYGTDTSYSAGAIPAEPVDIGSSGGKGSERPVEALLGGLAPGTTYHYRVVAENSNGEVVYGRDREFTTFAPASTALPDGRAWEMVSPPEKNNGNVLQINHASGSGVAQASAGGDAVTFVSFAAFAGSQSNAEGNQYVAERNARGWQTQGINSPINAQTYESTYGPVYRAFSSELSSGLLFGGFAAPAHGVENPPIQGSEAPAGYENYYRNKIAGGGFEALLDEGLVKSLTLPPPTGFAMEFVGASPNLEYVVIESAAALAPGVIENPKVERLYEWRNGLFQLLTVLPSELPDDNEGLHIGSKLGFPDPRSVSSDGSRVIWTDSEGALYVRDGIGTAHVRTVQLDAGQGGPESGEGRFLTASSNDSKVFFSDRHQLTATPTNPGGEGLGALYEFTLEPDNAEGGQLVNLTPDQVDPSGADVLGILGEGESVAGGSYVYFVAGGVLAEGASAGADNLYVSHEDSVAHSWTTRFIATLSPDDSRNESNAPASGEALDWTLDAAVRTARVTPDGTHLVFMSDNSLTGYDNLDANGGGCGLDAFGNSLPAHCEEVFVYDAAGAGSLSCASCNPSGERPLGPSGIPGGTNFREGRGIYQSRAISEDGSRVFFESYDALVPLDRNGRRDVYEYEGGNPYLISGGQGDSDASFIDASANGDDAFFITATSLVSQDADQLVDVYDARAPHEPGEPVGFNAPSAPVSCVGEGECMPPASPSAPLANAPSSSTFNGPGSAVTGVPAKPRTAAQIEAARLAKALRACRVKHDGHRRRLCESKARRRYGQGSKVRKSAKANRVVK